MRLRKIATNNLFLTGLLAGLTAALLLFAVVRFVSYSVDHTHYHANFAVYINGEREEFKGAQYYEDVAVCSLDEAVTPKSRVHMHEQIGDTVHVHDDAVTWGMFFQNLGWVVDGDVIRMPDGTVLSENAEAGTKISFRLNGQSQPSIANTVIGSEDKLLIDYGVSSREQLDDRYKQVSSSAAKANQSPDPASCGGSDEDGIASRFKNIFN